MTLYLNNASELHPQDTHLIKYACVNHVYQLVYELLLYSILQRFRGPCDIYPSVHSVTEGAV